MTPLNLRSKLPLSHRTYPVLLFKVQPLLQRHICSLSPGRSLALDATFRAASQNTGDANCIVLAMGALGYIVAFAALLGDRMAHLLPLLVR